jgi:hypothetical protein
MRCALLASARIEAVEVAVLLADLVGGVLARLGVVLLVKQLDCQVSQKALCFRARLALAQLFS